MSFLGNLAGGLLGNALGGAISSAQSANLAEKQAETQYKYWEKMQSNKHQLEVKDLEAAGLNKILSATNGSSISAPALSMPNVDSNLGTTAVKLSIEQQEAEIAKTKAEIDRMNAETERYKAEYGEDVANSEVASNLAHSGYLQAQTLSENTFRPLNAALIQAQESSILEGISRDWQVAYAQISNLKSGEALNYEQAKQVANLANKIFYETQGVRLDNERIIRDLQDPQKLADRDYRSSALGQILNYANGMIKDITPLRFGIGIR